MGLFSSKKEKTRMFFNSVTGLNINANERVELSKGEDTLFINKALTTINLETIKYKDILSIIRYDEQEIKQKDKSVVGRAIVGGVLTGGLGAIVGGMSGIGQKTKKGKLKYYVSIEYIKNNNKLNILLEDYLIIGTDKFISSIQENINKFRSTAAYHEETEENITDIPDQIRKLSSLKEDGIITNEEFENKKRELLSKM